jgi:hypothetical protein
LRFDILRVEAEIRVDLLDGAKERVGRQAITLW